MIERPKTAKDRIILALDVDNLKEARDLVRELKDYVGYFKVGLPLIVNYGFEAFRLLEEYGTKCYYDCKFHHLIMDDLCLPYVHVSDVCGLFLIEIHITNTSKTVLALYNV